MHFLLQILLRTFCWMLIFACFLVLAYALKFHVNRSDVNGGGGGGGLLYPKLGSGYNDLIRAVQPSLPYH